VNVKPHNEIVPHKKAGCVYIVTPYSDAPMLNYFFDRYTAVKYDANEATLDPII